jgi:hypothetical protein
VVVRAVEDVCRRNGISRVTVDEPIRARMTMGSISGG